MRKFKAYGSDALGAALSEALKAVAPAAVRVPAALPVPILEKRKRDENANRIRKHCAVIKRTEPRLLMELLQNFGSIEGLNVLKQSELIKRLEAVRKAYRI